MDRIVPSNLDVPMYATMGNRSKKRKVAHGTTAVVSKGKKARLEALQTPARIAKPSKLVPPPRPVPEAAVPATLEGVPPPRPVPEAAVPATLEGSVFVHSSKFAQPEGDDKTLCVDEWPFLQTKFCEKMTHIEDHEPFQPAPEVTASSQQAPCDFAPARAATSSHVTYENPGCLQGSFDQSSHIFGENAGVGVVYGPESFTMPRASRTSSVAKMRWKRILPMATTLARGFEPVRGTGARHRVKPWPVSALTGKFHRLDLPPESPVKQFVLFVGDSHLRALVDRYVRMPDGCLSFGFLSTPGASAAELRTELLNADIPRTPDIVCLLAPSNNLTATPGIEAAGVAFDGLLRAARSRWPKVFVLDFPPRLASELAPQQFLREEFRRVAAKNGM
ncbi:uncharacterized protein LOC115556988 [Gadus morhua]|uniref:uncharacterized protein LOC115556988 n=1 Tax=Gadus morhua TaxID=8049 RepID=UPI0011B387B2|nr:uncharacterized protein LOC115556988 [Gadus morhua]